MGQALTFRLGDAAFVVAVAALLEVRQDVLPRVAEDTADPLVLGTLSWQGQQVPAYDLRSFLGLPTTSFCRTFLLMAHEAPWALAVESVGGLLDDAELLHVPLPEIVCRQTRPFYDHLLVRDGVILLPCAPSAWLAAALRRAHG